MSLKKYSELSDEEKKKVSVMYADLTDQEQYLYNWDGEKYLGRQYAPPSGEDRGTVRVEPLVKEKEVEKEEKPKFKLSRKNKK